MRALIAVAACLFATGAGCVRELACPPPTFVPKLQFVPVPDELTAPLPVYERADGTTREYIRQAETNTAGMAQCNADRAATATLKPPTPQD